MAVIDLKGKSMVSHINHPRYNKNILAELRLQNSQRKRNNLRVKREGERLIEAKRRNKTVGTFVVLTNHFGSRKKSQKGLKGFLYEISAEDKYILGVKLHDICDIFLCF